MDQLTHLRQALPRRRPQSKPDALQTTFWMGICAPATAPAILLRLRLGLTLTLLALAVALGTGPLDAQEENRRELSVSARHSGFNPARLEVHQDDLIKVTFTAEDAPHSFNIDEYRIAKRARPGHPAVFEFRADRIGKFAYYDNLSAAGDPHTLRGELVVVAR